MSSNRASQSVWTRTQELTLNAVKKKKFSCSPAAVKFMLFDNVLDLFRGKILTFIIVFDFSFIRSPVEIVKSLRFSVNKSTFSSFSPFLVPTM